MDEKKNLIRDFKEKTAGMSFREKLSYFWTYYRLVTFVILIILICLISLTKSIIIGHLTDPVLNVTVLNDIDVSCHDGIEKALQGTFPDSTGFHVPLLTGIENPTNTGNMYAQVQFLAYLNAEELDVLICDEGTLEYCGSYGLNFRWEDITDTPLGKSCSELGYTKLYYLWFSDGKHTEEAEAFLETLRTAEIGFDTW